MHFIIRWPDGSLDRCYSPSLVVRDHVRPGHDYALADFVQRCRAALVIASDRVQARYGVACARALGELARVETRSATYAHIADARVGVVSFED